MATYTMAAIDYGRHLLWRYLQWLSLHSLARLTHCILLWYAIWHYYFYYLQAWRREYAAGRLHNAWRGAAGLQGPLAAWVQSGDP